MKPLKYAFLLAVATVFSSSILLAQRDRLVAPIQNARTVVLKGQVRPEARPVNDRGRVQAGLPLPAMKLMLKPSATQQAALEAFLEQQRNPASPDFHHWLTPEQFADRFGVSAPDADKIAAWLRAQGFTVDATARGRTWIAFHGTAQQAEAAFRTELHQYLVDNETHFANTADPSIPAALDGIVAAVRGLDDFRLKPFRSVRPLASAAVGPQALNGARELAPSDLATIYNIKPLYDSGIDGTGQKLAIIGQTRINLSDIQGFRQAFGLAKNDPQLVLTGADPGITGDLIEANLDLEWSGAMAPSAKVVYVYSASVITSIEYAIDQNIAPVMSMSYGNCEAINGPAIGVTYRLAAQQANAQGITIFVSSGDTGAAGCDFGGNLATGGLGVNMLASPPEITGVGGTQFNENGGNYWSPQSGASSGAALSYIPEEVWNETADGGITASGGGVSVLFTKPSWQTGPGVPADGMRDVPDISMTASGHDAYLVQYNGSLIPVAGTSAASPSMAGIFTLLNQYLLTKNLTQEAGLGNINPNLYRYAQTTPKAYHDIVNGSNIVPCAVGTFNCTDGVFGFKAAPGYDLATGLGSIDASYFITHWKDKDPGSSMTLTSSADTINQSDSLTLKATVMSPAGTSPTGVVSFERAAQAPSPIGSAPLDASGATGTASITVYGGQLTVGSNVIRAIYSGNNAVDGSAASTTVTVNLPVGNSDVVPTVARLVSERYVPDSHGWRWVFGITLRELAGTPTTLTDFTVNGVSRAPQLASIFSSTTIPAKGTVTGTYGFSDLTVPQTMTLGFSGVDAGGFKWTQQVSVLFMGHPNSALLSLNVAPATSGSAACPNPQLVTLQELTGVPVQLTRFMVGTDDLSSQIQQLFGTNRLGAYGELQATVCRSLTSGTESYEIDGTDRSSGLTVFATAKATYQSLAQNAPAMTIAPSEVFMATNYSLGVASAVVNVDPGGPDQKWTLSVFPNTANSAWLTVNPSSGTGPAEVLLYGNAAGLTIGSYNTNLIFQASNGSQSVQVPVTLSRGALNFAKIRGVANGASFTQTFAPGMEMSIFGAQLAGSTATVKNTPLPTTLSGVSVTVNGVHAPLYYISPSQINVQIPYETGAGPAVVGVTNNNAVAAYLFQVSPAAPGIFTGQNKALVPTASAKAGDTITLYMTGDGDTATYLPNGSTPAASTSPAQLPVPRFPLTVTVNGEPATVTFRGITSGLVGTTQVNFTVPADLAPGEYPVVVTVNEVSSLPATLSVSQ